MTVRVLLFAQMAEHTGAGSIELELPPNAVAAAVKSELLDRYPRLPWPPGTRLAVNQQYQPETTVLHEGDEVAVIPPVSGG